MTADLSGAGRIAVLSDVHGNDLALAAVLDDIAERKPEAVVCLGDMASGPFNAARAVDLLMAAGLAVAIRGNHDRLIARDRDAMHDSDRLAYRELQPRHREWLAGLPATARTGDLFLCHGTPEDDETFWLEAPDAQGRLALAPPELIAARAGGIASPVFLCGHSHLPRALRMGGQLLVNPGSVGQPAWAVGRQTPLSAETGMPDAAYAILEKRKAGWTAALLHVPYDARPLVALARERGMPGWAMALSTGRAPPPMA